MRQVTHIVLHCTATPKNTTIESIKRYWRENLGWKNPGYHQIIQADGLAIRIADDETVCNGVAGHNSHSIHISYIGGVDQWNKPVDTRTPQQLFTMTNLVKYYKGKYPAATVVGHRDFPGVTKACPSFDVKNWLKTFQLMAALLVLCLTGCHRPLRPSTVIQDSTWIVEKLRPTKVHIPSSKADLKLKLQFNAKTGKVTPVSKRATKDRASVAVSVLPDGTITATAGCDSLSAIVQARDREITRLRSERTTQVVPERYTGWYDILARCLAVIALLYIVYKLLKYRGYLTRF